LRTLRDPEAEMGVIVRELELDPGLTANLLRLANSPRFAGSRAIGSVRDAVVRMGTRTVFRLAVAASLAPLERGGLAGYDLPSGGLLEHSIAAAVMAEKLAERLAVEAPPALFTAALLHDVGKLVLGSFVEVHVGRIVNEAFGGGKSFEEAERDVLGIDHAEVGGELLGRWDLPGELVRAARWHHAPDALGGDLCVDLVHVADALCLIEGVGAGVDGLNYRMSADAVRRLGVTGELVEVVLCETQDELRELTALLAEEAK